MTLGATCKLSQDLRDQIGLYRRPACLHNVNRLPEGTCYSDRARAAGYLENVDDKRLGFRWGNSLH